jgi:serine/threonine-protein kinase
MAGVWKIAAAAAGVLVLCACGGDGRSGAEPEPGFFGVEGTIAVPSATHLRSGEKSAGFCRVKDGYEDLRTGASVVVTDAEGDVVGVGSLVDVDRSAEECRYSFEIANVPEGSAAYGVEVGSRGLVRYTRAELDDPILLPLN